MTDQPKKRGRPSKADIAAREAAQGPVLNGDTSREPEDVIESAQEAATYARAEEMHALAVQINATRERAQAYAMRVWAGQSDSIGRTERIARVKRALEGQNLPTDAIRFPGSDDDDWDEEDMQPVTWRKRA